jgi:hypothetical protein
MSVFSLLAAKMKPDIWLLIVWYSWCALVGASIIAYASFFH